MLLLPPLFSMQPVHSCNTPIPSVRCNRQLQAALQLPRLPQPIMPRLCVWHDELYSL